MRRYEVVFILRSGLSAEDNEALISRFLGVVTSMDGVVTKLDRWGERKLAYFIKKQGRGYYTVLEIIAQAPVINELERLFRIEEKVLRYMTVVLQTSVSAAEIEEAKLIDVNLESPASVSDNDDSGEEKLTLSSETTEVGDVEKTETSAEVSELPLQSVEEREVESIVSDGEMPATESVVSGDEVTPKQEQQ